MTKGERTLDVVKRMAEKENSPVMREMAELMGKYKGKGLQAAAVVLTTALSIDPEQVTHLLILTREVIAPQLATSYIEHPVKEGVAA